MHVPLYTQHMLLGACAERMLMLQVKEVRSGNYPVHTADHTLVLNWNRSTLPLLRNIAEKQHGCDKRLGRQGRVLECIQGPKERGEGRRGAGSAGMQGTGGREEVGG